MEIIIRYFTENFGQLNQLQLDFKIIQAINKLDRTQQIQLRDELFKTAIIWEDEKDCKQIGSWLQNCFHLIDKHAFRFNQVFFSPGHEIKDEISSLLRDAQSTVDLCIYTITDDELSRLIVACHLRGVQVRIITDDEKTTAKGSEIFRLEKAGIPIKTDHSTYHMHNKFGIIDSRIAITGSFNWTYTASKHNQENLLATSKYEIVKQYDDEFERLWGELFDF